jgi:hypothetical protein
MQPPCLSFYLEQYRLGIGPEDAARDDPRWDVILSVADKEPANWAIETHWLPILESSQWGYGPFYWIKKQLDRHVLREKREVYVCCFAGFHRSPVVVFAWLLSLGHSRDEADRMFGPPIPYRETVGELYHEDVKRGVVPAHLIEFFRIMQDEPAFSLAEVIEQMR